ncbi:MAG: sugar kinase [Sulfitobacter sp.]
MRIACMGEAMIELSILGSNAQVGVAGDTLNTAIYLHRTAPDIQVDYLTCVGDDAFSERIVDFVAAQGIGTAPIRQISGASPGLYAISTTPEGERSFAYWRDTSAARQLFDDLDFSVLQSYDAVYLSGISLAILPNSVRMALLDWLGGVPLKVIFDSNYRRRLWEDVEAARSVTRAFWDRADIALPSIDDEMLLFDETAKGVSQRFITRGGPGALKRGEVGPLSLGEHVDQHYPPAPVSVDTTAAGDSFNGGYLGAILSGKSQAEALMVGHTLAAKVVQHRGAIIPK